MNKILRLKSIATVLIMSAFIYSCSSDNNDDLTNPGDGSGEPVNAELIVTEANVGDKRNINVTGGDMGEEITVNVKFSSTTNSMKRLYITQDVGGFGEEPFTFTSQEVDEKPDGSLDLVGGDKNDIDFLIKFPAPNSMDNGTIVYRLWATTGRGDFRDITKRNVFADNALGTITVTFGTGTNIGSGLRSYTGVKLFAPRGDYASKTFFSLYDGKEYEITEGEEFLDLWDFGYYFTPKDNEDATLASVDGYDLNGVNLTDFVTVGQDDSFNKAYFKESTITSAEFDAITKNSDISVSVSSQDPQKINRLAEGDIVEIQDQYGNKGVIRVTKIFLGASGNGFDSDAFIMLDVKVQR